MYLTKHGLFLKSQFLTKSYFIYSYNFTFQGNRTDKIGVCLG